MSSPASTRRRGSGILPLYNQFNRVFLLTPAISATAAVECIGITSMLYHYLQLSTPGFPLRIGSKAYVCLKIGSSHIWSALETAMEKGGAEQ